MSSVGRIRTRWAIGRGGGSQTDQFLGSERPGVRLLGTPHLVLAPLQSQLWKSQILLSVRLEKPNTRETPAAGEGSVRGNGRGRPPWRPASQASQAPGREGDTARGAAASWPPPPADSRQHNQGRQFGEMGSANGPEDRCAW